MEKEKIKQLSYIDERLLVVTEKMDDMISSLDNLSKILKEGFGNIGVHLTNLIQ